MEDKISPLTLDFGENTVTYNAHTVPTGTIACQALNISRNCIDQLLELAPPLTALKSAFQKGLCPSELLEPAKASAHAIITLMQNQPPFCYVNADVIHRTIEELFRSEMSIVYPGLCEMDRKSVSDQNILLGFYLKNELEGYVYVLEHLGYSLGQYLDGMTEFAEELDTLPDRKQSGLARAAAKRFPDIITIDDESTWMSGMNESCQYLAVKDDKGNPVIGRRNHYVSVVGMLRADLFEGLAVGHAPKKCANCGRWFLTTNGRHTKYCDGIDPNSDKGVSCRNAGNRKAREYREKAGDNPYIMLYNSRCGSIRKRIDRKKLEPEIGAQAKIIAKNKLNKAVQDVDYARNCYEAEMELDALIAEAAREVKNAHT